LRYTISKALQHMLRQMFETRSCVDKLTVKMVLPEGGDNKHQKTRSIKQTA